MSSKFHLKSLDKILHDSQWGATKALPGAVSGERLRRATVPQRVFALWPRRARPQDAIQEIATSVSRGEEVHWMSLSLYSPEWLRRLQGGDVCATTPRCSGATWESPDIRCTTMLPHSRRNAIVALPMPPTPLACEGGEALGETWPR